LAQKRLAPKQQKECQIPFQFAIVPGTKVMIYLADSGDKSSGFGGSCTYIEDCQKTCRTNPTRFGGRCYDFLNTFTPKMTKLLQILTLSFVHKNNHVSGFQDSHQYF
jgi:hypothetical protein